MIRQHSSWAATVCALALLAGGPLAAQEGGKLWTFDVSGRLSYDKNADLDPGGDDARLTNSATLGVGFSSETRTEAFNFGLSSTLTARAGDGLDGVETEVSNPRVTLSYSRQSADAELSVRGSFQRDDISFLRTLADFVNDAGEIELPQDFEDLTGTGSRTARSLQANLSWGKTDPIGYDLSLGVSDLTYRRAAPALIDSRTTTLGLGVRLNINEVTTANLGWTGRRLSRDGVADVDTQSLRADLNFARPLGALTTGLTLSNNDRVGLTLGRALQLPDGTLNVSGGVSFQRGSDPDLTGRISWQKELPNGQLSLSARQAINSRSDDSTTRVTSLSAGYNHQITPLASLGLDLDYGAQTNLATDARVRSGSLAASYNWRLTPDWALSAGASYDVRQQAGAAEATSQSVFLGLSRSYTFRP